MGEKRMWQMDDTAQSRSHLFATNFCCSGVYVAGILSGRERFDRPFKVCLNDATSNLQKACGNLFTLLRRCGNGFCCGSTDSRAPERRV